MGGTAGTLLIAGRLSGLRRKAMRGSLTTPPGSRSRVYSASTANGNRDTALVVQAWLLRVRIHAQPQPVKSAALARTSRVDVRSRR